MWDIMFLTLRMSRAYAKTGILSFLVRSEILELFISFLRPLLINASTPQSVVFFSNFRVLSLVWSTSGFHHDL